MLVLDEIEVVDEQLFMDEEILNSDSLVVTGLWPKMNKQDRMEEYKEQLFAGSYRERTTIHKKVVVTAKMYDQIAMNLLTDRPRLWDCVGGSWNFKGKQICWSTATDEEIEEWRADSAVRAVLVELDYRASRDWENRFRCPFLVNTEGYDYARYVGFSLEHLRDWPK